MMHSSGLGVWVEWRWLRGIDTHIVALEPDFANLDFSFDSGGSG